MALILRGGWAKLPFTTQPQRLHRKLLEAVSKHSASRTALAVDLTVAQPRGVLCTPNGHPPQVTHQVRPMAAAAAVASGSAGATAAAASNTSAFGHQMGLEVVEIYNPEELNFILGHAHFIKTVEDLYEALVAASPSLKFGIAFCEASEGHGSMAGRRVRFDGNDDKLIEVAKKNALALGAGHTFVVFMDGGFPVSVLNTVKAVPEVCRVHCATANPTAVVLATLGSDRKGILGVIDGMISTAYETEEDKAARHSFLRMIGYKR